jgi:DNA-binding transcriptional ArsR family regulator
VRSTEATRLAQLGAVLASQSRASILYALMGRTAHTNGELARHLGLAPSSVSEHVGVLLDAGLVRVEAQGRHRYVRLADARTAELLERVGVMASLDGAPPAPAPRVPAALAFARSCYGHLAGSLGVRLYDGLMANGLLLADDDGQLRVTSEGARRFDVLGVEPPAKGRVAVRPCLDWSERRHHLAGGMADNLLDHFLTNGWLRRHPHTPRALQLGTDGRRVFTDQLKIEVP